MELSVPSGVAGCGCPISERAVRMGTASWAFRKRLLVSASEAEAATMCIVLQRTWMEPLSLGVGGELVAPGRLVRKK
jgi:hypothetical protein